MKIRILSILLAAVMVFTLPPAVSSAADILDSGICGSNLTWTLDKDGLLTISGTGEMTGSINSSYNTSWFDNKSHITRLLFQRVSPLLAAMHSPVARS